MSRRLDALRFVKVDALSEEEKKELAKVLRSRSQQLRAALKRVTQGIEALESKSKPKKKKAKAKARGGH